MEDLLTVGGTDAGAVILDAQLERSVRELRIEPNMTVGRGVLSALWSRLASTRSMAGASTSTRGRSGGTATSIERPSRSPRPIQSTGNEGGGRRRHGVNVWRLSVVWGRTIHEVVHELGQAVCLAFNL